MFEFNIGEIISFNDEKGEAVKGKIFRVYNDLGMMTIVSNKDGVSYIQHYSFELVDLGNSFVEARKKQLERIGEDVNLQNWLGI